MICWIAKEKQMICEAVFKNGWGFRGNNVGKPCAVRNFRCTREFRSAGVTSCLFAHTYLPTSPMKRQEGVGRKASQAQAGLFHLTDVRIIGLSMHGREQVASELKHAGASAYLSKTDAFETLSDTSGSS